MWIILAKSCSGCNELGVMITKTKPSEEEKEQLIEKLGGMFCISTTIMEVKEINEPIKVEGIEL